MAKSHLRLFTAAKPVEKETKVIEEFFRLPNGDVLLNDINPNDLAKVVTNDRVSLDDRFTIEIGDNRMKDNGLHKGDFVVVKAKKEYYDNDLVAIQLGDYTLVRRYFRAANRIRLECSTPSRQSMIIDEKTPGFAILGIVSQVIKEF